MFSFTGCAKEVDFAEFSSTFVTAMNNFTEYCASNVAVVEMPTTGWVEVLIKSLPDVDVVYYTVVY